MSRFCISFTNQRFSAVQVAPGQSLSLELDAKNSPVLFGCRTGICGTCVIEIEAGSPPPPDENELELLDIMAPDRPKARLACQIDVQCDLLIREP